ncbi:MAG: metallophosphoesterase, partial [Clostridia bacterium]|nr:metallophosphoesterase [Clostridia bacterium]
MRKVFAKISAFSLSALMLCTVVGCSKPQTEPEDKTENMDIAKLSFYAVNDLHGKFMDTDTQPGMDEFTAYMKALYSDEAREEILLSSGDMWQGTVESSTNKGQLMTEWMNEVGFVSMTLGNHEYDWGAQVLTPNSELAEFPFLAINVTYNGQAVDYCRASTVVEKSGVKIGIIGAIGDCLSSISGDYTDGLAFATGSELTKLVKTESTRLRKEEGCDFIVYSMHSGYGSSFSTNSIQTVTGREISDYYDTALSKGYVDLVFEGHTHQSYILKDEYGVYHLQGGGENRYVS